MPTSASIANGLSNLHNENDRIKFLQGLDIMCLHDLSRHLEIPTYKDGRNVEPKKLINQITHKVNVTGFKFTITGEVQAFYDEDEMRWGYKTIFNRKEEEHQSRYDNQYEALRYGRETLIQYAEHYVKQNLREVNE